MAMYRNITIWLGCLVAVGVFFTGCGKPHTPKEYGYFRIAIPEHGYTDFAAPAYPYRFSVSTNGTVQPVSENGEPYWINIVYPSLNATIHCSYKAVNGNLRALNADAEEFVYSHAVKASAIPQQEYADPDNRVFGVYYEFEGNTATPVQFYVTDSTRHFFRAAVYINCIPNQDSLAPVIDYLKTDVRQMIETIRWQ